MNIVGIEIEIFYKSNNISLLPKKLRLHPELESQNAKIFAK